MKAIWAAIVNLFKSLTGMVSADVKKLEVRVISLEQAAVAKVQSAEAAVAAKVEAATPPTA